MIQTCVAKAAAARKRNECSSIAFSLDSSRLEAVKGLENVANHGIYAIRATARGNFHRAVLPGLPDRFGRGGPQRNVLGFF